jgi:hypothetical protein
MWILGEIPPVSPFIYLNREIELSLRVNPSNVARTGVMIFKKYFRKKTAKILAFFAQTTANFRKNIILSIFAETRQIPTRNEVISFFVISKT